MLRIDLGRRMGNGNGRVRRRCWKDATVSLVTKDEYAAPARQDGGGFIPVGRRVFRKPPEMMVAI